MLLAMPLPAFNQAVAGLNSKDILTLAAELPLGQIRKRLGVVRELHAEVLLRDIRDQERRAGFG
jgi:hypothetical protein